LRLVQFQALSDISALPLRAIDCGGEIVYNVAGKGKGKHQ